MASAHCRSHTDAYRNCLKECRDSGRSKTASKTCKPLAVRLDACREDWRKKHTAPKVLLQGQAPRAKTKKTSTTTKKKQHYHPSGFDGTRVLPHPRCRPLSCDVQRCIEWRKGDQSLCLTEIQKLKACMEENEGTVAAPTEGDRVWSV
ncbi:unnamed protein product [Pseudo-nitzschia multistriata]|uniref:Uncharacterized protein n=1 Tax=Pseudo-nitzschia multistriata TaxID=183589 RepID=A0A448ZJD3_9STRA|nr:unnamed protein product [Pseudo-nitzschia multistriata]